MAMWQAMERLSMLLQKRIWSADRLLYELSLPSGDAPRVHALARLESVPL